VEKFYYDAQTIEMAFTVAHECESVLTDFQHFRPGYSDMQSMIDRLRVTAERARQHLDAAVCGVLNRHARVASARGDGGSTPISAHEVLSGSTQNLLTALDGLPPTGARHRYVTREWLGRQENYTAVAEWLAAERDAALKNLPA
jgi:hypothetical protein